LDMFFLYEAVEKFDIQVEESEIAETVWIKASELETDKVAFESQKAFLKSYLKK